MQAPDFDPIDAAEQRILGFDFAPQLQTGDTLTGTPVVSCAVHNGTDAAASSRMIGAPSIVPSISSGNASQAVAQKFGTMIAGTVYVLSCVCPTALGETLEIWCRIVCRIQN